MKTKFEKVSLLYDGACYLCNMEMDIYRKKDPKQILDLVDISQPHFDASSLGFSEKEVTLTFMQEIWMGNGTKGSMLLLSSGKLHIYKPLSYMASSSLTRLVFFVGYELFACVRPHLPLGVKKPRHG